MLVALVVLFTAGLCWCMIVRWLCLRLSLAGREVCCSEFCRLALLLFGVVIFVVVCWFVFGLWWWACCGLVDSVVGVISMLLALVAFAW